MTKTKNDTPTQTQFKSLSQSKIEKLPNGNVEITITIPWNIIADWYQTTLKKLSPKAKIKGFRPGKAPEKLVEKQIGKTKIYQEMIKTLATDVYLDAVKTHKLLPIVNPKLNLVSSDENKDWILKAITAEIPQFEIANYQEKIKKALAPEKIWIPGKDKDLGKKKEENKEKKLKLVFDILLGTVKLKIPQLLIEDELNRMLSRLIEQTSKLGLTVEQYLASVGKNSQQLREEYQKQAEESIKLELILAKIANQEKIQIEEGEIDKMIKAIGDEKLQKTLETPSQRAYIQQILRKRKVLDILTNL